jgi:capsular exopolysaccharide synthesis family protein
MSPLKAQDENLAEQLNADEVEWGDGSFSLYPTLLAIWQALVRWRLVIAGIIGVTLVAGLVLTLLSAPRYMARTQVEISREQKNVTNVAGLESQQEGRDLEFYATQYSLLRAESLADRVVRKLQLAKTDAFFDAHGFKASEAATGEAAPRASVMRQREHEAAQLLLKNISVDPVRNSRLVNIFYTSRSPQLSAQIANAWAQEFIRSTMDRQFASTADARKFLEERLATLRTRLEESERDAVLYAANRNIVTLETSRDADGRVIGQRTLASSDLEALNKALLDARADRIAAQSKAGPSAVDNSSEVLENLGIANIRSKRAELAAAYAQMMVRFEPGYPDAQALKRQIDALDAALAREVSRVAGSRQLSYAEALSREQQLEQQVAMLRQQFDRQRRDSIQFNIFQRDADTNRQLYDALLQRYKEIGVAGNVGTSNIGIVDEAQIPKKPSAPSLRLNLLIALLVGIGLAGLAVFALEQIDEGIRSPDDVRRFLDMSLLGNVPIGDREPISDMADPKSQVSEAYFSIFSTLAFATNHGQPRSFAISSSRANEGKTISSFAIAEILGRTGKKVLLIDGDMRSPSLHRIIGSDNEIGLSNILVGAEPTAAMIRDTGRRGLHVLTTGMLPPSPAELLSGDRLKHVVNGFLEEYDHVIVDAPPVLGLADALLISGAVEGIVFIVESEKTQRRVILSSLQRLQAVGARIFGVVVTKVDTRRHAMGYGYGYGYGYGLNYGEDAEKPA